MGYELHITRKSHWSDEDGPTISDAEWHRIIADDPELRIDTETECGDWVFAAWRDDLGWLAYTDGEIRSKHPSDALIGKMVAIANLSQIEPVRPPVKRVLQTYRLSGPFSGELL